MKSGLFVLLSVVLSSCALVQPGERAVISSLGALSEETYKEGPVLFNPFYQEVVTVSVQTKSVEERLSLPSREGLTVEAEISILYRLREQSVRDVITQLGLNYERAVIMTTFRSVAANVSSEHNAKDMHSGQRTLIENEVVDQMNAALRPRGFEIESVLLKSIILPTTLSRAIEAKLSAEQDSQRMQFVLDRERQEADRKRIEAEGIKQSQQIIDQGLTERNLKFRQIEALRELATSSNAKTIILNQDTPVVVQTDDG